MWRARQIPKPLLTFKSMPPLYHTIPGCDYNPHDSEVLHWIASKPEMLGYLLNYASQKGLVTYDRATGMWQGVDES